MNTKFNALPGQTEGLVYIRTVRVADLPDEVRSQIEGVEVLFSVHRPNGERLALVADRGLAFELARQNDFAPVSVH